MLNNKHSSIIDLNKNEIESTTKAIVKKTRNKSDEDENLNDSTRVALITVSAVPETKSTNKNTRKENSQNRKKLNEDKLNKMSSKSVSPSTENRLTSFSTSTYCQFSFEFAFFLSWLPNLLAKVLWGLLSFLRVLCFLKIYFYTKFLKILSSVLFFTFYHKNQVEFY